MAWEWVAPVTTGVVGVVGIASTFWTARQSRVSSERTQERALEADKARRLEDEKREAYAAFLSVVVETQTQTFVIATARADGREGQAQQLSQDLTFRTWSALQTLDLVAGAEVRQSALDTTQAVHNALAAAADGHELQATVTAVMGTAALMRRDLGRELDVTDRYVIEVAARKAAVAKAEAAAANTGPNAAADSKRTEDRP